MLHHRQRERVLVEVGNLAAFQLYVQQVVFGVDSAHGLALIARPPAYPAAFARLETRQPMSAPVGAPSRRELFASARMKSSRRDGAPTCVSLCVAAIANLSAGPADTPRYGCPRPTCRWLRKGSCAPCRATD